ncbi:MAG: hypothetical protein HOO96_44155 [Polyangiaceae bacterium]|nr:hypothetical protein [Polyangiaceae bacterium]
MSWIDVACLGRFAVSRFAVSRFAVSRFAVSRFAVSRFAVGGSRFAVGLCAPLPLAVSARAHG